MKMKSNNKGMFIPKIDHIIICFIASMLLVQHVSQAQSISDNWYFGQNAGIHFDPNNSNIPTALTNGAMNTSEGCASISNSAGLLLFYTDGITVWNSAHSMVATNLGGSASSTQSAIIIPRPGNANQYYIVTTYEFGLQQSIYIYTVTITGGTTVSVNVSSPQVLTITGFFSEKITAVCKKDTLGNSTGDFWLIAHGVKSTDSAGKKFYVWRITSAGASNLQIQAVGAYHGLPNDNAAGYLKASYQGDKLALACLGTTPTYTDGFFELFNFNNVTGAITQLHKFPVNQGGSGLPIVSTPAYARPYGVEFSPNGSYFYGTLANYGIYQFATTAPYNVTPIPNVPTSANYSALQLAVDGNIYVAGYGNNYLSKISSPNTSPTWTQNGVSLGVKLSSNGLPNFVQCLAAPPCPPTFNSTTFSVPCPDTTYLWMGSTYYMSGTYVHTSLNPCGSVQTDSLILTIGDCCKPWLTTGNYAGDCNNTKIDANRNILGIKETNPNALRVFTNNTEKMRVTSGGNVGIGTTNPTNLLHIGGASGPNPIRVETLNSAADSSFVTTDNNGVFHKRSMSSLSSAFCEWTRNPNAALNTIYPNNVTDKVALGTNNVHTNFLNSPTGIDARLMLNGGDIIIQENPLNNPGAPDQGADVYLLDVNGKGLAITGQNGAAEVSTLGANTSLHFNSDGAYHAMILHGDPGNKGKVQIGNVSVNCPNLTNAHLFVEGGVQAEGLLITNYLGPLWPDYVFEAEHKLKPLAELSTYIKENKHLPGIPTSKEIGSNGLNVAEMQAKQMEKIEELTLYMIEMKQEIEGLKKENEILKSSSINTKK